MDYEILVFKSESKETSTKDPYQAKIEKLHLTCHQIPVLQFTYKNLDKLQEHLDAPGHFSGVVLTSPRAVFALKKCKIHHTWKKNLIFAVGRKTKKLAKDELDWDAKGENSGSGAILVSYILKQEFNFPLLIPCGNLATDYMANALKEGGKRVVIEEVYETYPHPALASSMTNLRDDRRYVGVFFSPSGVDAVLPQLKQKGIEPQQVKWVAIGPTTALHMVDNGLKVYHVCEMPDPISVQEGVAKATNKTHLLERMARESRQRKEKEALEWEEKKKKEEEEKKRQLRRLAKRTMADLKAKKAKEEKEALEKKTEDEKKQEEEEEMRKELGTILTSQEGLWFLCNAGE